MKNRMVAYGFLYLYITNKKCVLMLIIYLYLFIQQLKFGLLVGERSGTERKQLERTQVSERR